MVNYWSSQLSSHNLGRFSGIWPAAILPDPGLGSSSFSDWTSVTSCMPLILIFHNFFSKSRKNAQKTRQNLFSRANKHQFCQFFFSFRRTFDYQGVDLQQHADLLWVVQEARMWFVFFLAMPSVKQILANYIIIWWNNGIWWYLMVFVCLFCVCVCFFVILVQQYIFQQWKLCCFV